MNSYEKLEPLMHSLNSVELQKNFTLTNIYIHKIELQMKSTTSKPIKKHKTIIKLKIKTWATSRHWQSMAATATCSYKVHSESTKKQKQSIIRKTLNHNWK